MRVSIGPGLDLETVNIDTIRKDRIERHLTVALDALRREDIRRLDEALKRAQVHVDGCLRPNRLVPA